MEKQRVLPFLSFTGRAEEAMRFYAASLPGAKITRLERYGKGHPMAGEGGTVMMGPEPVGNIRKCAWVTDRFGVTWQPVRE